MEFCVRLSSCILNIAINGYTTLQFLIDTLCMLHFFREDFEYLHEINIKHAIPYGLEIVLYLEKDR
jgi:hypothetical protein